MQLLEEELVSEQAKDDPASEAMTGAIEHARASIGEFFKALRLPRKGQHDFQIQAIFEAGDEREQIWLSDLDFSTKPATGIVSTRPRIKTIAYRQRVPFRPDQMSDWMYNDNGRQIGGFTLPALKSADEARGGILARLRRRLVS
jgi:uncharacterized protein YegJ (DUF2314 family)